MNDDFLKDYPHLRQTHQKAKIIAFAIMGTLLIYLGVVEFFLDSALGGEALDLYTPLLYTFIGLTLVQVVAMMVMRNVILSGNVKLPAPGGDAGTEADDNEEKGFTQRLFTSFIITYAICESIAIYGLVLFVLGKDKTPFYTALGIALFLMVAHFPKYREWESRLKDAID